MRYLKISFFFVVLTVNTSKAEEFDTDFLVGRSADYSLDKSKTSGFINGNYLVDIFINGKFITEKKIKIVRENETIKSCMTAEILQSLTIKGNTLLSGECRSLTEWIEGSFEEFDEKNHALNLNVPYKNLVKNDRYKVSPSHWDYGESMFYSNYMASLNSSKSRDERYLNSAYLDLESGFNYKSWRIHNRTTTVNSFNLSKTYLRDLYIERPIPEKEMVIIGGSSFYSGEGLDSFSFKGFKIFSDDSMLNQGLVKYAPIIEGILSSQAKIVVIQQNNIIYQGVFPPGRYKISNLELLNSYDSLTIYINEAGKPQYQFVMPVHSASGLLKPGRKKWSLTAGDTNFNNNFYRSAIFAGLSYRQGLTNSLSLSGGGLILSNYYSALTSGVDFYTAAGFFSGKISLSHQEKNNQMHNTGLILNSSYNKSIDSIGMNISSGFTRYSRNSTTGVEGSLVRKRNSDATGHFFYPSTRNEVNLNLSKSSIYGDFSGQLSLTDYYRSQEKNFHYGFIYQNFFSDFSLSLSVNRTVNDYSPSESTYNISVAIPFGIGQKKYLTNSGLTVNRHIAKLHSSSSSTFGRNDKNNFNVYTAREIDKKNDNNLELGGSLSLDRQSNNTALGLTKSANFQQFSANTAGSFVLHNEGITLGKTLGDSFALVHAPGAGGARIDNGSVILDGSGYALLPTLTPYADNIVNITPGEMKGNIEIPITSKSVTPVSGSALRIKYRTITGLPILVKIRNKILPVGLTVRDDIGTSSGMTGQFSLIYLRQAQGKRKYSIIWGDRKTERCDFEINISSADLNKKFLRMDKSCVH